MKKQVEESASNNEPEVKEKKKRGRPKKENAETVEAEIVERGGVGVNGNLIPFNQRTESERREISTKAGVASGAARRRKKELREFMRDFLMQEANPTLKANMRALGVDDDNMTNLAALCTRVFTKGVSQGDLNAARTAIEWAGMAPLQQEKENEAIARMSQVMQLASGDDEDGGDDESVIFYIPSNNRPVITDNDLVTVSEET